MQLQSNDRYAPPSFFQPHGSPTLALLLPFVGPKAAPLPNKAADILREAPAISYR